jgi:hypothetical protein
MPHAAVENSPTQIVYQNQQDRGAVFVTPQGRPIVPTEVLQELALLSPRIKVEWVDGAWGTSSFAVKMQWADGDPRWERVQKGEISPAQAFDIEQRFPREIRTGEIVAWLRNRWGDRARVANPRAVAEKMIAEAQELLRKADEAAVDQVVETGTQRILDESDHARLVRGGFERAHPMVNGADFAPVAPSAPVEQPRGEPKRLL